MAKKIFPSSIINFSEERLIHKHSSKSKIIYWCLIFVLIIICISFFLIKVDVYVHARGKITSTDKSITISPAISGRIYDLRLKDNRFVMRGDTLLIMDRSKIVKTTKAIQHKTEHLELLKQDLEVLVQLSINQLNLSDSIHSALYIQEYKTFISNILFHKSEVDNIEKDFARMKKLYSEKAIARSKYEEALFEYESQNLQYYRIFEKQLTYWQQELDKHKRELILLKNELHNKYKEQENYFIVAPMSGYIQNLKGLEEGCSTNPNQNICTICPTSNLIAEIHVSGQDIGLIETKQKVKLRIDAFNYNQWGMIEAEVSEIFKDIQLNHQHLPTFKVICSIHNTQLTYRDKTVNIKKGMSVNANFFLTERTIAQLLYDNLSDWINPNSSNTGNYGQ